MYVVHSFCVYIWVIYNNSLTWILGPFADDSPRPHHHLWWGRGEVVIIHPDIYTMNIYMIPRSWWYIPRYLPTSSLDIYPITIFLIYTSHKPSQITIFTMVKAPKSSIHRGTALLTSSRAAADARPVLRPTPPKFISMWAEPLGLCDWERDFCVGSTWWK